MQYLILQTSGFRGKDERRDEWEKKPTVENSDFWPCTLIRAAQGRSGRPSIVHLLYRGVSEHSAASFSYISPPFWEVLLLLPRCPPQAAFVSLQHTEVVPPQISSRSWWQRTQGAPCSHICSQPRTEPRSPCWWSKPLSPPNACYQQLTAYDQIRGWKQTCTWTRLPITTELTFPP